MHQLIFQSIIVSATFSGFLCMFSISHSSLSMMSRLTRNSVRDEDFITEKIFDQINFNSRLQKHLQYLSEKPHMTGQARDDKIREWIEQSFHKLKLDVNVKEYEVMLSYPSGTNRVALTGKEKNKLLNLQLFVYNFLCSRYCRSFGARRPIG